MEALTPEGRAYLDALDKIYRHVQRYGHVFTLRRLTEFRNGVGIGRWNATVGVSARVDKAKHRGIGRDPAEAIIELAKELT